MKHVPTLLLLCSSACGRIAFDGTSDARPSDGRIDTLPDARMFGPWSAPQPVPGASSTAFEEEDGSLNSTKTELYFNRSDDIWLLSRATANDPWGAPQMVTALSSGSIDETPRLSPDDLTMYFASDRTGPSHIYRSTRTAVGQPWSVPVVMPEVSNNGAWSMHWLSQCNDGHYFTARVDPASDYDVYAGVLGAGPPTRVDALDTIGFDSCPYVTPDCTTLYMSSDRTSNMDIYMTTRASSADAWGPLQLTEIANQPANEQDPFLSQDGTMMLYVSDIQGASKDIYFMTRSPL